MKKKTILFTLFGVFVVALIAGLNKKKESQDSIYLRLNSNYESDSLHKQKTGLSWALSFLGASLPEPNLQKSLKPIEGSLYELNIKELGFEPFAIKALREIIKSLKGSEEYRKMGGIDLGEFIVYTLGSSWHYYAITGARSNFIQFKSNFDFKNELIFPVLNSDVAKHHRLIRMTKSDEVSKMAFIAEEGRGDLSTKTFEPEVYEVFDIMKNGQLRFAIYDKAGNLTEASSAELGRAGKPVKCFWCHEINIQTLFTPNDSVKNYMSPRQFKNVIYAKMQSLQAYRKTLKGGVDFNQTQDHALMELLYITYMEPSEYKLSKEWGQSNETVSSQLKEFKKHPHREYEFLNELMERREINRFSPYKTVQLPESVWEENNSEPNLFK